MLELTDSLKNCLVHTANTLKAAERRRFMAEIVQELGPGGQRLAQRELGWSRETIRKGQHETASGIVCVDAFSARGRHRVEQRLPDLLTDIRAIVDEQSQTDPSFKSTRLYTRLSAAEVRRQLQQKGYDKTLLPSEETIRQRLNQLGYQPSRVAKAKPQKKFHKPMPSLSS